MSDWTEETLASLRAAHYTPRAWATFLAASLQQARELRAVHSRAHRQTLGLAGVGLAGWAGLALAGRPWLALAATVWWVLLVLMVDWHLGMLDGQRDLGLANMLSLLRGASVPLLPILPSGLLVAVLIPAGLLDGLDGPVARARGEATRLGYWLDAGLDGIVLGAAAIGAARAGVLPAWAAALVLARHGLQWLAVAAAYFARARRPALDAVVPAKLPGLVLFVGLALSALRLPEAAVVVAVGALGGLGAFTLTFVRSRPLLAAR